MGNDLYLIWNNECVAELGRANSFKENERLEENKLRVIRDIIGHVGCTPQTHKEVLEIVDEIVSSIQNLCDEYIQYGMVELLNNLREQGFETLDEYEWKERQKIKNMPDYFEPKI